MIRNPAILSENPRKPTKFRGKAKCEKITCPSVSGMLEEKINCSKFFVEQSSGNQVEQLRVESIGLRDIFSYRF